MLTAKHKQERIQWEKDLASVKEQVMVSSRKAHEKQLREKQEEFAKDMGRANQRSDERMQDLRDSHARWRRQHEEAMEEGKSKQKNEVRKLKGRTSLLLNCLQFIKHLIKIFQTTLQIQKS